MGKTDKERNNGTAYLTTVNGDMAADLLEGLLASAGIPILRVHEGTGDYVSVLMGHSVFGIRIYVPQELLEQAKEIVEAAQEGQFEIDEEADVGSPEEIPPVRKLNKTAVAVLLIVLLVCIAFLIKNPAWLY